MRPPAARVGVGVSRHGDTASTKFSDTGGLKWEGAVKVDSDQITLEIVAC